MEEFLTVQQKLQLAHCEFSKLARSSSDGTVSWNECENIIKRIYSNWSQTEITNLLSDADEDGIGQIPHDKFMDVIDYLFKKEINRNESASSDEHDLAQKHADFYKKVSALFKSGIVINDMFKQIVEELQLPQDDN